MTKMKMRENETRSSEECQKRMFPEVYTETSEIGSFSLKHLIIMKQISEINREK